MTRAASGLSRGRALLWLGLAAALAGCGGGKRPAGEPPDSLRLIDRLERATFDVGFEPDPSRPFFGGRRVARERFREEAPNGSVRLGRDALAALFPGMSRGADEAHDASPPSAGTAEALVLEPPGAFIRPYSTLGQARLRAQLWLEGNAEDALLYVTPTRGPDVRAVLDDPTLIRTVISPRLAQENRLRPMDRVAQDGSRAYAAVVDLPPGSETLLLVVATPSRELRLRRFELFAPSVLASKVFESDAEFPSPWTTRLEVEREHREANLLPAPGSISVEARLPTRAPRLSMGLTALDTTGRVAVRVEVARRGNDDPIVATWEASGESPHWRDVELDLQSLAGEEVVIRLEAGPGADGDQVAVAFGSAVIEGEPVGDGADPPLDVVLISIDTVRADRLELYGASRDTSPRLAELGRSSVVFETAISTSESTLPAHASLFTGQMPRRHQVSLTRHRLEPDRELLLGQTFRRAGYETMAVTGGGYVDPAFGFAAGFERYGTSDPVWSARGSGLDAREEQSPTHRQLLARLAAPRRRPMFLFLHTYAAHEFWPRAEDLRAVGASPETVERVLAGLRHDSLLERKEVLLEWNDPELTRLVYDACVRGADALVGDVVRALREAGRLDRTCLVVLSDHGEQLQERGEIGHGMNVFEELIHVPLLVRAPGLAPRRVEDVVSLVDVAPTLRALCGLDGAAAFDGRSLLPLLGGGTLPPRPALAESLEGEVVTLRGRRHKLVVRRRPDAPEERWLFDLTADPHERRDVATEQGELTRTLERWLGRRLSDFQDPGERLDDAALDPGLEADLRALGYLGG